MNADRDVKFWRCEQFGTKDVMCKARLHTDLNNTVKKSLSQHICDQSAAHVEAQRIKTGIKRRAAVTMETPSVIRTRLFRISQHRCWLSCRIRRRCEKLSNVCVSVQIAHHQLLTISPIFKFQIRTGYTNAAMTNWKSSFCSRILEFTASKDDRTDKAESVKVKLEETQLKTFDEIFGEGWWDKGEAEDLKTPPTNFGQNVHHQIDRQNTQIGQIEPNSTDQKLPERTK
uniref:FLYWCH-type domain-containing protein n=1 Tax=Globodera rostochiensis TaxID=31243 RepID=A0A914HBE5_GLORO